jgi:DNA-binding LytR/AlgR family response regulator
MQSSLYIRHDGRNVRVALTDIEYIEADKNYTILALADKTYLAPHSLLQWESILPYTHFCRVHRKFIVALDKINAFDKRTAFLDRRTLPIGDEYRARLEKAVLVLEPAGVERRKQPLPKYG